MSIKDLVVELGMHRLLDWLVCVELLFEDDLITSSDHSRSLKYQYVHK